jgi:hypothetical protein
MANNATNYLEGEIIKHIFRTGSFTKPTVLAVALFTAVADAEAGTVTEVAGGSYARVEANPLDANWDAPAGGNGQTSNLAEITFPAPTADWGTVSHIGIYDAASNGNLLIVAPLTTPREILNGDGAPSFAIGQLTFTIS